MAGYSKRFGEEGLQQFLHTTRGWHCPMRNDRHQPSYPRSVSLPDEQYDHFDKLLGLQR
jgi:hypothetical protein